MSAKTIAIIGAGPAGLIAAERLAGAGHRVTLYERMASPARKFLLAGRGGLNLTHSEPFEAFLGRYREAAGWLEAPLRAFPPQALRDWADGLGAETFTGSSGRVFPRAMKASPLLRAWLGRLEPLGVGLAPGRLWSGWSADGALTFSLASGGTETARPDATLLALGGASWPRLGSDGGWVALLERRGVTITPLRPANGGFTVAWSQPLRERFAGQPLKRIVIRHAGEEAAGEAMIDADGIEGGAIYALSAPIREAFQRDGAAVIRIDLRPDLTAAELAARLARRRKGETLSNHLRKAAGLAPAAIALMRDASRAALPAEPEALAALIKAAPLSLAAPMPIARAISSAGGIARDELDDRFMLKRLPGVFAAGEMLDWEAPTGGYLLQASFATGVAAAAGMAAWLTGR
ncbi:TIGR03862 family flavoprotein [Bosea sp. (in: a-proteobacteria)]|uniref:NAD(P)/FAD-dependent oxidoreductase n=1 Tax=Bosea sp. (in: a-proteobacteria) TaxID=1871050 RepID=UPI00260A6CDB|nr:TIGR03862 family flavoprotein [Bosea sp. (in: a-proteobacteria)]MCO5089708.1 TIGR03862 family flavoprotein [Bosea sp. (in: a-proteobacteria)]